MADDSKIRRQLVEANRAGKGLLRTTLKLIAARGGGATGRGEGAVSARDAADVIGREVERDLQNRGRGL